MFISAPHNGVIFLAVRGARWGKYRWHVVNRATLAEKKIPASQVPRHIRKAAYGLYERDLLREKNEQTMPRLQNKRPLPHTDLPLARQDSGMPQHPTGAEP